MVRLFQRPVFKLKEILVSFKIGLYKAFKIKHYFISLYDYKALCLTGFRKQALQLHGSGA